MRASRLAFSALATSSVLFTLAGVARAEAPNAKAQPVYVLSVSTDDSDDQADALTQALRSRVRQASGWSLLETPQSFETLSIALKCPPKPDAGCLQRIGDQLKADHFVWGTLAKGHRREVTADIHLWTRGKGDADVTQSYSDNLKDAGDESLRAVASQVFGKLTGAGSTTGATGTIVVHAGSGGGRVLVDGAEKGTLESGVARVEATAGAHTIAVRVPGFDAAPQQANVEAGGEQELTLGLSPSAAPASDGATHGGFPVRKVLEYGALVVGGGLLIASGVETAQWISDSNQSNSDRQSVPRSITDVCATQINAAAQDACHLSHDAQTASALGWTFGIVGAGLVATGVVLMLTDKSSSEGSAPAGSAAQKAPQRAAVDVVPTLGPKGGALGLRITF